VTDGSVRGLLDREEIVAVAVRYATALDSRDWPLMRTCFEPDVVGEYEGIGTLDGVDAIEEVCRGALEPLDASQHLLGNHVVEVTGDDAAHTCQLHAQHVRLGAEGGDLYVVAGSYTDRLRRTPDGWRITHRRLAVSWTDGNPAVIQT
jgi:3-phenylpropionate/cinnamic acid dioxygenase small subunit